jgi:hypothetical protein
VIGESFGHWVVTDVAPGNRRDTSRYTATCEHGCIRRMTLSGLLAARETGARCKVSPSDRRSVARLVGTTIGRWTVTSICETGRHANVVCECGSTSAVLISNLTAGLSRSCGCLQRDKRTASRSLTAQHAALYRTWVAMRRRCNSPDDASFRHYGGRGITVCGRWDDFLAFKADMGPKPTAAHSLDRIDNDGGYWCGRCEECAASGRPANCRWATNLEQQRNTRRNVWLTNNGVTLTASEWARVLGVSRQMMRQRVVAGASNEKLFARGDPARSQSSRRSRLLRTR